MIRNSPCELYTKFLLAHPQGYSPVTVKDIVRGQQLDCPGVEYVEQLRAKLRIPTPYYPTNRLHQRSHLFLMKHKLVGFFFPEDDCIEAHELLKKPRAKETIETMALTGDGPGFIASRLQAIGISATPQGVERYLQFYWNLNLVDETELRALLKIRTYAASQRTDGQPLSSDQVMQARALEKVQYQDSRVMVTDMAVSPMSGLMNQLRMGMMPSQIELARLVRVTQVAASVRSFESVMQGGPRGGERSRDYALTAKTMGEMLENLGSPDLELQKELQQLALKTDTAELPFIQELEGEFETNLEPEKEKEDVESK